MSDGSKPIKVVCRPVQLKVNRTVGYTYEDFEPVPMVCPKCGINLSQMEVHYIRAGFILGRKCACKLYQETRAYERNIDAQLARKPLTEYYQKLFACAGGIHDKPETKDDFLPVIQRAPKRF